MPVEFEAPDVCAKCGTPLKRVVFVPLCDECLDKANAEADHESGDSSKEGR